MSNASYHKDHQLESCLSLQHYYTYLLPKVNPLFHLFTSLNYSSFSPTFRENFTAYTDALENYSFINVMLFILSHLFLPPGRDEPARRVPRKIFLVVLTLRGRRGPITDSYRIFRTFCFIQSQDSYN